MGPYCHVLTSEWFVTGPMWSIKSTQYFLAPFLASDETAFVTGYIEIYERLHEMVDGVMEE